jgi:dTDP-glucose 4,6-dehydratase
MRLLITGGAGFIGSNFIRYHLSCNPSDEIINVDSLTYAGNPNNLFDIQNDSRYYFFKENICNQSKIERIIKKHDVDAIINFAAETHVDRSINNPDTFLHTNILGTHTLLNLARQYELSSFLQISTDEVYGSRVSGSFCESDRLTPSSPYSASKASSDLIALSYKITYDLPVIVTRCTNNFGPYQYPEKLIPLFVTNLLRGKTVPVYGTGKNVRDWIYVVDHCSAIDLLLKKGRAGEIYNIGSGNEMNNLEITELLLCFLEKGNEMITFVKDRPGHDFRYSIDCSKIKKLGWKPAYSFKSALNETVDWYKMNSWWWEPLKQ